MTVFSSEPLSVHLCLVMEMRLDGRLPMPKHLSYHAPHEWWYTSVCGGHQLDSPPQPGDEDFNRSKKWNCPGWHPEEEV